VEKQDFFAEEVAGFKWRNAERARVEDEIRRGVQQSTATTDDRQRIRNAPSPHQGRHTAAVED
jgi:hypothetical protein